MFYHFLATIVHFAIAVFLLLTSLIYANSITDTYRLFNKCVKYILSTSRTSILGLNSTNCCTFSYKHWPWYSLGSPLAERNPSLLVQEDKKMKLCGKALSVSWWIESLGKSQRHKPCTCGPSALGLSKGLHSSWYTLGFVTQCPNVQCTYCSFWRGKLHFVCVNKTRWDRPHWKQTLNRLTPPLCPTKKRRKKVKHDTWHLTPDTWHLTCDTWHGTCDIWHMVGVNILSKCQLPRWNGLGFMISWRLGGKRISKLIKLKLELALWSPVPPT